MQSTAEMTVPKTAAEVLRDEMSAGRGERPASGGTGEAGATGGAGESGTAGRAGRPDVEHPTPSAIKMLEAAIRHFAKTFDNDPDEQREAVKALCKERWGVEHFKDLSQEQFTELYEGIKQPGGKS